IELIENKIGNGQSRDIYDRISLTKLDIFNYLNKKNIPHKFIDYKDFKRNFFNDKEFVELSIKPDFLKSIELINKDGGYSVLAHPGYQFGKEIKKILININQYKENLINAKKLGLWGIEMHSYENFEEADSLNKIFSEIAIDCELNITFGSDFHAPSTISSRQIGCVKGDFQGFIK
ncbi:hypothetical protein JXR93_06705, partial [bacterium]|nr:hypothetical protein [bacterium]